MERADPLAIIARSRQTQAAVVSKSWIANRSHVLGTRAGRARGRRLLVSILLGHFVLEYIRPPYIVELRLQLIFLVLLLIGWANQPNRPWSRNLTLQTAFLALCLLSITYAQNYFSAYIGARTMFGNVAIALAVTWLMARRRDFVIGVWFWVLVMAYQATHAILYNGFGTGGFLGDENDIALGCCTILPFALQGMAWLRGWRRWASGALALLFTAAIVATSSRGGFVGLMAVVVYSALVSRNRIRNLAITAAAALLFWAVVPSSYKGEIASIFENKQYDTGESRTFLWKAAWLMWLDHPVLGVGVENFNWNVGFYQPREATGRFSSRMYLDRDWTMSAAHSLYFTVLSECGLVGSVLFVSIVIGHFSTIRRFRRRVGRDPNASVPLRRDTALYGLALSTGMVGYLAAGTFLSVAIYPYPWLLSALAVAWERAAAAEITESERREANRSPEPREDSHP
jgi:O-antigen ligase